MKINNSDDLRDWLKGKPKEYSVVIVSRTALRVFPLVEETYEADYFKKSISDLTKFAFQANLMSWVASKFPRHDISDAAYDAYLTLFSVASDNLAALSSAYAARVPNTTYDSNLIAAHANGLADSAARAYIHGNIYATDIKFLEQGMKPEQLAKQVLWHDGIPPKIEKEWQGLKNHLLTLDENWDVWIEWYEDILAGRNWAELPNDLVEQLSIKIAEKDNEWWEQDSASINADIKKWRYEARREANERLKKSPPEPKLIPGLQYQIKDGKLSEIAYLPEPDELETQARLHEQIKKMTGELEVAVASLHNQFPEFTNTVKEYSSLVQSELGELDVTGVWAVGGVLASFAQSYQEQNIKRTLEAPLEPNVEAKLQALVRVHGAFVLGFQEGRELVERADRFALNPEVISQIEEPANKVLKELTENDELVDEPTRKLHQVILDGTNEFGWGSAKIGYSAYSVVSNSVLAIGKFSIKTITGMAIVSGASTFLGDPNMEIARTAITFLQHNGSQLLTYFNHSPEMRAYIEYVLRLIKEGNETN